MKNQMKRFVAMLLASLAILALAGCSNSGNGDGDKADYPKENITVIVPYSAGGPTDMSVRALLDAASKYLPSGVSFMPENQTGAGGGPADDEVRGQDPAGSGFLRPPGCHHG